MEQVGADDEPRVEPGQIERQTMFDIKLHLDAVFLETFDPGFDNGAEARFGGERADRERRTGAHEGQEQGSLTDDRSQKYAVESEFRHDDVCPSSPEI